MAYVQSEEKINFRKFILSHLLVALLILSFLSPLRVFWDWLDLHSFQLLNSSLDGRPNWQIFWALLNHSNMDWVGDAIMLIYFLYYILKGKKGQKQSRIATLIFCILYIGAIAYFLNRIFFRKHFHFYRPSPSRLVEPCIKLSEQIDWLSIKDGTSKSFPGDHATTAISFFLCFKHFAGTRAGLAALLYTILVSLPRLVVGAHWLSDILIGSLPTALLCFAWIFYTPLHRWCINGFTRCIVFVCRPFRRRLKFHHEPTP